MMVKYYNTLFMFLVVISISITVSAGNSTANNTANNTKDDLTNNTVYSDNLTLSGPTSILKIITIPIDGAIYIDNKFAGSGLYYNTTFPAGIYRISFGSVSGYEIPANQTINVLPGNQTNIIVQYTTYKITPPDISISIEASKISIAADEQIELVVKIKNNGIINAYNVSLNGYLPDCAVAVKTEKAVTFDLEGGESRIFTYYFNPAKVGLCIFDPSKVIFSDLAGNKFSKFSDEVKVFVSARPSSEPHLAIDKQLDRSTALVDDGVVITVKLRNDGTGKALNVSLMDKIPSCAEISQGDNKWNGDIAPEEQKLISYIINMKIPGLCQFDAAAVSYSDANGNGYIKYSEPLNIYVKEKSFSEMLDPAVRPIVIIGTGIGSLITIITVYRNLKGKIRKEK